MSGNPLDTEIYEQFIRIEWLMRRRQFHRQHGPASDPHRGQGRVLALLKLKVETSQRELSAMLDIRSQSLGELLVKLERSGYITRAPSKNDRRVMDIRLTDAGMQAADTDEPDYGNLFSCLSDEEQDALKGYLSRIIVSLEEQAGTEQSPQKRHRFHSPKFL